MCWRIKLYNAHYRTQYGLRVAASYHSTEPGFGLCLQPVSHNYQNMHQHHLENRNSLSSKFRTWLGLKCFINNPLINSSSILHLILGHPFEKVTLKGLQHAQCHNSYNPHCFSLSLNRPFFVMVSKKP